MRFSTAAFMMVLAVCVTPLPAIAVQPAMSEAQARKLSESVFTEVLARAQNLHGIAESLNGHEAQAVGEICVSATVANDNVQWFASLATIYQRMESQNDKSEVQMWAARQLDSTKKALEIHINHINSLLVVVRTPAALSEAQKIRDSLQQVRRELEHYGY